MTNTLLKLNHIDKKAGNSSHQSMRSVLKAIVIGLSMPLLLIACSSDNTENAEVVTEVPPAADDVLSADTEAATIQTPAEADPVIEPIPEAIERAEAEVTETSSPEVVLASDAGATLYEAQCKICHESGLLNAPKYGDSSAWSIALTKDKETLYMHSAQGFNKMPAQAINGVTEAQVKAAVDYMLVAVS